MTPLGHHDEHVRNLNCQRVQCDEIWSFVYSKQKNVPENRRGDPGVGDTWTWVALDADDTRDEIASAEDG